MASRSLNLLKKSKKDRQLSINGPFFLKEIFHNR